MHSLLHGWLERTIQRVEETSLFAQLREATQVTERFYRNTGPKGVFGQVTLSAVPAAEFSYISRVIWPDSRTQLYEDYVMDGILDVLLTEWMQPILGVAVTL